MFLPISKAVSAPSETWRFLQLYRDGEYKNPLVVFAYILPDKRARTTPPEMTLAS